MTNNDDYADGWLEEAHGSLDDRVDPLASHRFCTIDPAQKPWTIHKWREYFEEEEKFLAKSFEREGIDFDRLMLRVDSAFEVVQRLRSSGLRIRIYDLRSRVREEVELRLRDE